MKIQNSWAGVVVLFSVGLLAACSAQAETGELEAQRQSEMISSAGSGSFVTGCPDPSTVYPINRIWGDEYTGCRCTTHLGVPARLLSKCDLTSSTCGYLYCMNPSVTCPDPAPTYSIPGHSNWVSKSSATLGCSCVTTTGYPGHLLSGCSIYPASCGYLICVGDQP